MAVVFFYEHSGITRGAPAMDEADGVRVGDEPTPGMNLRSICRGHEDSVFRVAWPPTDTRLASPSKDHSVRIWNTLDGPTIKVIDDFHSGVLGVAWSPCGDALACGGRDFHGEYGR